MSLKYGMPRRTFMKALATAGVATASGSAALAGDHDGGISDGDAAILRFFAAVELIETDFWQQYTELANNNPAYMAALNVLDEDMSAYVTQNTNDEVSHAAFINAFLASVNRRPVNLDAFRTLPSSPATGAQQLGRLTNLMHLNVDTSWYTRYRSSTNPDFGESSPQVVNIVNRPAIPLHDGYTMNQIQAIANTAAFHFASVEQFGSSLYEVMSLKASELLTKRIVTSIGGTEVAHFEIWNDKAGDAPAVDSGDGLVFPDLSAIADFPNNLVMPKPCTFISRSLPLCSVIRPTNPALADAEAAVRGLTASGLFQGQSSQFFATMTALARDADRAGRRGDDD